MTNKTINFIEKAFKVHGNKYNYKKVNYINNKTKVIIICSTHGEFLQTPDRHLTGSICLKCKQKNVGDLLRKSIKDFIYESNKLYGNFYSYDKSIYVNNATKLIITCKIHGDFEKTPNCFLSGIGCKKCGNKRISDYQKQNPNGWDLNNWDKKAKNSKNFDSFKVYIIKCWNENEEFYKIGRTFMTINNRFKTKRMLPYNFKVIKEILGNADFIFNLENELKNFNKEYKYKPKIKFSGINECYSNIKNICLI